MVRTSSVPCASVPATAGFVLPWALALRSGTWRQNHCRWTEARHYWYQQKKRAFPMYLSGLVCWWPATVCWLHVQPGLHVAGNHWHLLETNMEEFKNFLKGKEKNLLSGKKWMVKRGYYIFWVGGNFMTIFVFILFFFHSLVFICSG